MVKKSTTNNEEDIVCGKCSSFKNTSDAGAICEEKGVEVMIGEGIWEDFNLEFLKGKLAESTPDWCPKKNKK